MNPADINELLEQNATALDIPEYIADEAVLRYEAVADWLAEQDSPLREYSPEIYPQGSFRLGTPIRPLGRGAEFDIDIVCRLAIPKDRTTQRELKRLVGDRLRADEDLAKILKEKRRCWTLSYPQKFHLDVLPAIPDPEATEESILLTDKELTRWQHSNPIGYADWFFGCMPAVLEEERSRLAKTTGVDIEEVPRWRVRTPLQRAIQLLKRHRDLRFKSDDVNRPASILITTLAAQAYEQERDLYSALLGAARTMGSLIENRNGTWWVANPAHPEENFADKWNESPEEKDFFLRWLRTVQTDLGSALAATNKGAATEAVARAFGGVSATPVTAVGVSALSDFSHADSSRWVERLGFRCQIRC